MSCTSRQRHKHDSVIFSFAVGRDIDVVMAACSGVRETLCGKGEED
jgi:hypothetical protein